MLKRNSISSTFLLLISCTTVITGCSQHKQTLSVQTESTGIEEIVATSQPVKPTLAVKQTPAPKQTPLPSNSIWRRLLSLYALPEIDNERIQQELNEYLKHPKYLARIQQRAEPYLYMILETVEKNKIPGEFALLPIVESSFNPNANSSSQASGLWQFMPATGRIFGLKQNWWYDGRRDVYASTQAAVRYLKHLGRTFDQDWLLALASYNLGEGALHRTINKNKANGLPSDFWSLSLRPETMNYVPRLLALARIFAHAEQYGIELKEIENKAVFEMVDISSQLDLQKAAELAQIKPERMITLNPGFNFWCTAPDGPHRLLIPVDSAARFKRNLAKLTKKDRMNWARYQIKPGENLSLIAEKHNTSVPFLTQINRLDNKQVHAGHYLLVPNAGKTNKKDAQLASRTAPVKHSVGTSIYTVKKGDSLWTIARQFSIDSKELAQWNKLSLSSSLHPGQTLMIKFSTPATLAAAAQSIKYTVKDGDSLFNISRKFNVSVTDLRKWNAETVQEYLHPGQKLKVFVETGQPTT